MRIQASRPIGTFPKFDGIKDEATKQFCKDLANLLLKQHRDISDDVKNMQNVDAVDSLPTASEEYQGRMVILKGSGTAGDKLYIGVGTGSGGYDFKEVTI